MEGIDGMRGGIAGRMEGIDGMHDGIAGRMEGIDEMHGGNTGRMENAWWYCWTETEGIGGWQERLGG